MKFEHQLKALIFYHLEEYSSGRHLIQALEEDDLAIKEVAPPDGIKKSSFSEAVNHRGLEQLLYIFEKLQTDATHTLPLVTSLLDESLYPYSLFKELYHLRWGIEEGYKTLKCTLEVESFTGKTTHAIYQEFYASLFLSNLQAIITRENDVQGEINLKAKERKYDYQENRTSALC